MDEIRTCKNCLDSGDCTFYHNYPEMAEETADTCAGFLLARVYVYEPTTDRAEIFRRECITQGILGG